MPPGSTSDLNIGPTNATHIFATILSQRYYLLFDNPSKSKTYKLRHSEGKPLNQLWEGAL